MKESQMYAQKTHYAPLSPGQNSVYQNSQSVGIHREAWFKVFAAAAVAAMVLLLVTDHRTDQPTDRPVNAVIVSFAGRGAGDCMRHSIFRSYDVRTYVFHLSILCACRVFFLLLTSSLF